MILITQKASVTSGTLFSIRARRQLQGSPKICPSEYRGGADAIQGIRLAGSRRLNRVLQAKSKRLTLEARKGNDLQIKDDFKKAIQDSYDQALSCTKALLEGGCKLKAPNGS